MVDLRREFLAQPDKSPNDKHAHVRCPFAAQDIRRHQRAVLAEDPWPEPGVSMLLRTGRKLRPVLNIALQIIALNVRGCRFGLQLRNFRGGQLKCEVVRKSVAVAPEPFIETPRRYAVKAGEIGIEDDPAA